jgi:hypothetical protein
MFLLRQLQRLLPGPRILPVRPKGESFSVRNSFHIVQEQRQWRGGEDKYLSRIEDLLDLSQSLIVFPVCFERFDLLLRQNFDITKLPTRNHHVNTITAEGFAN